MDAETIKATYALREKTYRTVLEETRGQPRIVQIAKCLARFLEVKPVCVSPDDILAGNAQYCDFSHSAPANFREEIHKHAAKTGVYDLRLFEFEAGIKAGLFQRGQAGHTIAAYDYVLGAGIGALIETARLCSEESAGAARDLARASGIVCAALSAYIGRYSEAARLQGLRELAAICAKISVDPPDTFHEAVQLLWFLHEVVIFEQLCGSMSLGRLDVTLIGFYERDVDKGVLDNDDARKIIEALFGKLGGLRRGFQNVTLGGRGADGRFVDNAVTRICLEVSKKLMIDQPLLSLRYAPDMGDELWDEALSLMETGIGFPAMFNDRIAVQSKLNAGVSEEDAQNYGIVGCVEVSVPGKEYAHTEGLRINWAKITELICNNGICRHTGHAFKLSEDKDLAAVASFDEFYNWYKRELRNFLTLALDTTNLLDESYGEHWPTPYMSSLMRGCVKKGRDVNSGGAIYNLTTVNGCGMANAVDSLCAVKTAVFEKKLCSLPELAAALADNFAGSESLRQALIHNCPKFGNDDFVADGIMAELTRLFCDIVNGYKNPRGGAFQSGLYTVDHHVHMGLKTGALPSGRKSGETLANGFSPGHGMDRSGPTAVINSLTKNELSALGNGMVLDLKFTPGFFKKNKRSIRELIEAYFALDGYEIQFNVVDRETLIDAQKNPDSYRNLIVRVSGFSAYFTDLGAMTQNEIIARTVQY